MFPACSGPGKSVSSCNPLSYFGTTKSVRTSGISKGGEKMKSKNNISLWISLMMLLTIFIPPHGFASPDAYEPDNTLKNAKPILLHDSRPEIIELGLDWSQSHNFYHTEDEDWIKFYAFRGEIYTVKVKDPGPGCNAVIGIYDKCGNLQIPEEVNDEPVGVAEYAEFRCEADGIYYARIRQSSSATYGEGTDYKLVLFVPVMEDYGHLHGSITPCVSEAIVTTTGKTAALVYTREVCQYGAPHPPSIPPDSPFTLTVEVEGFETYQKDVVIKETIPTQHDIILTPLDGKLPEYHSADYNPPDHEITLSEMLRVQQLYSEGSHRCDPGGEDGYALGYGDQSCIPHDSDYALQDWSIGLNEFLRMLQLWSVGEYYPAAGTEDGFAPASFDKRKGETVPRESDQETLTASHSTPESSVSDDSDLTITNQIEYTGALTGLGMTVNLPNGWSYVPNTGDDAPTIRADSSTGDLEIFWSEVPDSPAEFTYTVRIPQRESRSQEQISSRILYRRPSAGEMTMPAMPDPLSVEIRLKGDISGDDAVTLADALIALVTAAGSDSPGMIRSDYVSSGVDVNGDDRIGIEEVIHILQRIAGLN